jgi:ABC-type bacteriocin/lantibiotic exporter with double-glycine peptidase domain
MVEASKLQFFFITLMVFALSGLELFSLALIGLYLGFIVDPVSIIERISIFLPDLATNIQANISLSNQYIIFGIGLITTFFVKLIFVMFANFYIFKFSVTQQLLLQEKLMHQYINQNYESYIQSNSAFSITAVSHFARRLKDILQALFRLFADGLLLLLIIFLMLLVDAKIFSILATIFISFSVLYYLLFITRIKGYGEEFNLGNTNMIKSLTEISNGFKEIKILGKCGFFKNIFSHSVRRMAKVEVKQNLISVAPRNLLELMVVLFIVLAVIFTILWGDSLSQTVITLGIFSACAIRIIPMVTQIFNSINAIKYGEDALIQLFHLVSEPSEQDTLIQKMDSKQTEAIHITPFKELSAVNLSFSYHDSKQPIISNSSFEIQSGDFIGIVGPSGSGKTTFVDLLLGLLKPQTGKLIVDGVNIFDDINGWRSKIAYIPQEIFLIDDSIKNNIILGDQDSELSNLNLDEAISQSKLQQLIDDLPEGYLSNVGDKGMNLSGGQRQRVAIARALYHQREILILDEATSALDSATEAEITKQLEALKGKKTIICIAHRASTLRACNKIYTIENGIITIKDKINI